MTPICLLDTVGLFSKLLRCTEPQREQNRIDTMPQIRKQLDSLVIANRAEAPIQVIAGLSFQAVAPPRAIEQVIDLGAARASEHIHLANAFTIAISDKDPDYGAILHDGLLFADGKPISWLSTLYRQSPRVEQIRGPRLFLDVLDRGRAHGLRHFLLGSSEATLESILQRMTERFPGVKIVGCYSPPFRPLTIEELAAQDAQIRASDADLVWVGLGTPKQDVEAQRLACSVNRTAIAIGAAFDFAAGTLRSAPAWVQTAGLEWAFRLASEPRRLWRRYLFGNARFVMAALRSNSGKRGRR